MSSNKANNLSAQVSDLLARLSSYAKSASSPYTKRASSFYNNSNTNSTDPELSQLERGSYRNRFCAVRAAVPVVPQACAHRVPHIAPGPQTAQVVGLSGETLTTERNHRVKVQFAWQRGSQPNAGGLTDTGSSTTTSTTTSASSTDTAGNAPNNETSGTWVRVSEALAGPNWGTQFTPRIGTEVLIDYLDADLDQPVIVAQLYNGADTPPFAAGVDSAATRKVAA